MRPSASRSAGIRDRTSSPATVAPARAGISASSQTTRRALDGGRHGRQGHPRAGETEHGVRRSGLSCRGGPAPRPAGRPVHGCAQVGHDDDVPTLPQDLGHRPEHRRAEQGWVDEQPACHPPSLPEQIAILARWTTTSRPARRLRPRPDRPRHPARRRPAGHDPARHRGRPVRRRRRGGRARGRGRRDPRPAGRGVPAERHHGAAGGAAGARRPPGPAHGACSTPSATCASTRTQALERLHGLVGRPVGDRHRLLDRWPTSTAVAEPPAALLLELPQRDLGGAAAGLGRPGARRSAWARDRGAAAHLDGARLWEASAGYGRPPAEVAGAVRHRLRQLLQGHRRAAGLRAWPGPEDVVARGARVAAAAWAARCSACGPVPRRRSPACAGGCR